MDGVRDQREMSKVKTAANIRTFPTHPVLAYNHNRPWHKWHTVDRTSITQTASKKEATTAEKEQHTKAVRQTGRPNSSSKRARWCMSQWYAASRHGLEDISRKQLHVSLRMSTRESLNTDFNIANVLRYSRPSRTTKSNRWRQILSISLASTTRNSRMLKTELRTWF